MQSLQHVPHAVPVGKTHSPLAGTANRAAPHNANSSTNSTTPTEHNKARPELPGSDATTSGQAQSVMMTEMALASAGPAALLAAARTLPTSAAPLSPPVPVLSAKPPLPLRSPLTALHTPAGGRPPLAPAQPRGFLQHPGLVPRLPQPGIGVLPPPPSLLPPMGTLSPLTPLGPSPGTAMQRTRAAAMVAAAQRNRAAAIATAAVQRSRAAAAALVPPPQPPATAPVVATPAAPVAAEFDMDTCETLLLGVKGTKMVWNDNWAGDVVLVCEDCKHPIVDLHRFACKHWYCQKCAQKRRQEEKPCGFCGGKISGTGTDVSMQDREIYLCEGKDAASGQLCRRVYFVRKDLEEHQRIRNHTNPSTNVDQFLDKPNAKLPTRIDSRQRGRGGPARPGKPFSQYRARPY
eukprot:NODE_618_length_1324_cov_18.792815_g579_i0.p1 GENE.NODE_618_length_1324_cov_18.792815_g579_i0~~NODE_618_length_1324_cov_18.792815_g579_i0.p1  ORF type:complete len:405 (-),score=62.92 NODE_618_length_1324_cov_18.792815_g579_i0:8-1222(-)